MENSIIGAEKGLDKLSYFLSDIKKFFLKNPEIYEKFIEFINEPKELIY